ncbi:MAG: DUF3011 domain-containing protein [Micropepsaceae bacterium]
MTILRLTAALATAFSLAAPAFADYLVECSSGGYRYTYCPVDTRFGVELAEQKSTTPCTLGSSWGYDSGGVWTDQGCRGVFRILEGRARPRPEAQPEYDVDEVLAELEADGTMDEWRADDELNGRSVGSGVADAIEACAYAAEAREMERGAAGVVFESVDQVVPRARRAFDLEVTLVVRFHNGKARRFDGECRVQNGQVSAYSKY